MGVLTFEVRVAHEAVGPRGVPGAAGVWRAMQEVVVGASAAAGWPASRFKAEGVGFVVVQMRVRHHRELHDDELLTGRTWIRDFRRRTLTHREVRLDGPRGPLADATQRWAHVDQTGVLAPASEAVLADFPPVETGDPGVDLDKGERDLSERWHEAPLRCWYQHLDAQRHANHPMFIEWIDEATMTSLAKAGRDPHDLVAVAEQVTFQAAVLGGTELLVRSRVRGRTDEAVVLEHRLLDRSTGSPVCRALTWRRLSGAPVGELEGLLR